MTAPPLVSVIIPARNAAATLERALRSALRQDWRPLEVVVVDDASTDATAEVADRHRGEDVRVLRLDRQHGASGARNRGVEAARGEFIAFLDADDEWLPGKIARQMAVALGPLRPVLVSCAAEEFDGDGRALGDLYPGRPPAEGPEAWRTLLAYNYIATPSVLARRTDILAVGGFDPSLPIGEDQDLWIRLAMTGAVGYVPETLVRVHITPNSLSTGKLAEEFAVVVPMILRHVEARRHLLSRREVDRIVGERLSRLGRNAYVGRHRLLGGLAILRAVARGHRPVENLLFLLAGAPPARWLKSRLRAGRARLAGHLDRRRRNRDSFG